jgi:predicted dehydrogenase/threonine dehydrogenase-like Zn-dependent dehydrogenase
MHQVLQNVRTGQLRVATVPDPVAQPGQVLIANAASVISAGTEKMIMELSQKSLLGKARERPDHVRRVLEKVRNEGLLNTLRQVREKLDEPMKMGYASAGVVLACGAGVSEYKPGDRVASNGPHAGVVSVAKNLVARVPDKVTFDHAAFAVLGAIALQGVRLAKLNLGESALVIGLGLVGQLTVSLLAASGVRVIGTDLDPAKCELALKMGAAVAKPGLGAREVEQHTRGLGVDAVLITASTKSNGPIDLAAAAVRAKGRVVLVGVVGLEIDRRPFFFKECEFVVSCSYGPGRYDFAYEDRGHDYPAAYVRWTEQRNIQAVLDLMGAGKLDVSPLISHRFAIERGEDAYKLIEEGNEPYVGIVLTYPKPEELLLRRRIQLRFPAEPKGADKAAVGVVGAGNFARMVLLPAITATGTLRPSVLCSAGGMTALHSADKLNFDHVATDEAELYADPKLKAVFLITRHDLHARQVLECVRAGKHVFVEKPLCLTEGELAEIESALADRGAQAPVVMVGFNRRFSPAARAVKKFFAPVAQPLTVSFRFNAGAIPAEHWTQDDEVGGGRLVGEACHAIDLATYLVGSPVVRVYAESIGGPAAPKITDDQCFITLRHENGSISSVGYLAGGDKAFPKERIEVIGGGRVAVIDDFRTVTTVSGGRTNVQKLGSQDKGHAAEVAAFADALARGGAAPIPWNELRATTLASILAVRSLREGMPFDL